MKIVVLHPPLYPVNHTFYNILGKYAEVVLYHFGEYPLLHRHWNIHEMKKSAINYKIKVFGKGPESLKNQMNPSFFKDIMSDKPDFVISVAFWFPSLYASLLRKLFGYKFLITTDAIKETEKNISYARHKLRELMCKNTDMFLSASSLTTEYLYTLSSDIKIKDSLQTIDTVEWKKEFDELLEKNELRNELDLPLDKNILLGVGGFISKKNWESVFEQIDKIENTIFVLVGGGELEDKYYNYINSFNLTNKVKIISRKEGRELKKYFKASDIFIFPSLYDQFGYVVFEALASGLPVVCSKNSGASSVIENGKNGFVIDPESTYIEQIQLITKNLDSFSKESFLTLQRNTLENKAKEWLKALEELK
ncbi:MAG: glycosyltransferase [Campylobacterota bacterium]|nr:glycosyltransferase [Campylobacterota bacterium]